MQKENHVFPDFPLDEELTENKNSLKLGGGGGGGQSKPGKEDPFDLKAPFKDFSYLKKKGNIRSAPPIHTNFVFLCSSHVISILQVQNQQQHVCTRLPENELAAPWQTREPPQNTIPLYHEATMPLPPAPHILC